MSFIAELRRRNVFRVGIAYIVGAWLLLQLTDVLSELLTLPEAIGPIVVAIVAVGLPVVLFAAWAFELTPDGVKRESEVDRSQSITPHTGQKLNIAIIIMLTIAVGYLLVDKFSAAPTEIAPISAAENAQQDSGDAVQDSTTTETRPSIAVLPFENRSRLEDDAFFVAGIHDDLLTNLARIGSLKVISRTSVGKYEETEKTIPEIAAELDVTTIMEGAVQRAGDTVRINVQLIDAKTDEHLWAEIFDREMTADNLFAIQTEISTAIAEALEATLTDDEQRAISSKPTENLEAYNAYLRGRQLLTGRNSQQIEQGLAEFRKAVELDPGFALAWVGIADAADLSVSYGSLDFLEGLETREAAVQRALALNPLLGEAHLAVAQLKVDREQDADASFRRAIELNPNYATAYHWYGNYLGRSPPTQREALANLQKAAQLDPLSPIIQSAIASRLVNIGRFDEARRKYEEVHRAYPDFTPGMSGMAYVSWAQGRFDDEIVWRKRALAKDANNMGLLTQLQWAYMAIDNMDAIRDMLAERQDADGDHYVLMFSDMVLAMWDRKFDAAIEQAKGIYQRTGNSPFSMRIVGYLYNMIPDHEQARAAFAISDPQFSNPDDWDSVTDQSPETSCLIAWNLIHTGDGELGNALLDHQINYFENELPNYQQHADRHQVEFCYAARGDWDKAIDHIERRFAHQHYTGWFFLVRHKVFEPLWDNPRFIAVMQELDAVLATQRENLTRLEAEGQP